MVPGPTAAGGGGGAGNDEGLSTTERFGASVAKLLTQYKAGLKANTATDNVETAR